MKKKFFMATIALFVFLSLFIAEEVIMRINYPIKLQLDGVTVTLMRPLPLRRPVASDLDISEKGIAKRNLLRILGYGNLNDSKNDRKKVMPVLMAIKKLIEHNSEHVRMKNCLIVKDVKFVYVIPSNLNRQTTARPVWSFNVCLDQEKRIFVEANTGELISNGTGTL